LTNFNFRLYRVFKDNQLLVCVFQIFRSCWLNRQITFWAFVVLAFDIVCQTHDKLLSISLKNKIIVAKRTFGKLNLHFHSGIATKVM
jgi:hypothetical protein